MIPSSTAQTPATERGTRPPKQREGHNLLERLKTFKTETLRFLTELYDVPFTNNLAEQELRMMKVKMKIFRLVPPLRTLKAPKI